MEGNCEKSIFVLLKNLEDCHFVCQIRPYQKTVGKIKQILLFQLILSMHAKATTLSLALPCALRAHGNKCLYLLVKKTNIGRLEGPV